MNVGIFRREADVRSENLTRHRCRQQESFPQFCLGPKMLPRGVCGIFASMIGGNGERKWPEVFTRMPVFRLALDLLLRLGHPSSPMIRCLVDAHRRVSSRKGSPCLALSVQKKARAGRHKKSEQDEPGLSRITLEVPNVSCIEELMSSIRF